MKNERIAATINKITGMDIIAPIDPYNPKQANIKHKAANLGILPTINTPKRAIKENIIPLIAASLISPVPPHDSCIRTPLIKILAESSNELILPNIDNNLTIIFNKLNLSFYLSLC